MPPKRRPNKSAARSRPAAAATEPEEPAQSIEVVPTVPTAETSPPPNSSENPLFLPGYSDSSSDDDNDNGSNNGSVEIIPSLPPPPPPAAAESPPPPLPQPVPKPTIVQPTQPPPPPRNEDDDTSGGEETTEEDPVVQTYDIQITTSQLRDLYIFQYPVRPREQPYTKARNACPLEARFKPKSGLVEVDIPVNVHVNYDEEKGRVWGDAMRKAEKEAGKAQSGGRGGGGAGSGAGGGKKRKILRGEDDNDEEGEGEEEEDLMYMDLAAVLKAGRILNRQTLGSKMQPDGTKYMAGVFKNEKLYLTPITSTLQLRPQFHHIDTLIDLERAANKALHPVKQEARAIQLSVKNSEDPSSQLSSSMKAVRMAEEENWTKLHWVDQDTDDAWGVYEDVCLTGETKEGEGEGVKDELLKCVTTKREYVEWLSAGKPIVRKEGGGK